MKKLPKLSAITAVSISAIMLLSAYIYVEWKQNQNINIQPIEFGTASEMMQHSLGGPPTKGREAFEAIIHHLAFVSVDDMNRGLGTASKINMESRRKYFSNKSWASYQEYVLQQKEDMKTLGQDSGAPYKCDAKFDNRSQKYIKGFLGKTTFTASGYFSCGAWDAYGGYGKFKIEVSTKDDVTKPDNLIIDHWNLDILEPVKPKIYKKKPCIKETDTLSNPLLKYELEHQRKYGCI